MLSVETLIENLLGIWTRDKFCFGNTTRSEFAAVVIRANPGLPGLVGRAQSRNIGEMRVDIA